MFMRPTKYKKEFAEQARKLCAKGFTDKDLADFFDVSESTIYEWKLKNKEFSETIKEAKEDFDTKKVEDTLLKRALGYEATESKIEQQEGAPAKKTMTKKHIPPSDTALIFWLRNRSAGKWSNNPTANEEEAQSLNITFGVNAPVGDIKVTRGE